MKIKLLLIDLTIKLLVAIGIITWISLIVTLANSGASMIRQLLGCMFTTMAIYALLFLCITGAKRLKASLHEEPLS